MQAVQPQGVDAILAALNTGGAPTGNIANLPPPVNAQTGITALDPAATAMMPQVGAVPGLPQAGAVDPMAGAMAEANPAMIQMIVQALLSSGAFNATQQAPTQ